MKNMFKGKNKLILALPIILILLFGTVLYLDKDNTAKASTSSSPVVMEPPVEETKAVREKIAAYEMEAKRQREEEEAEKESHIEEGGRPYKGRAHSQTENRPIPACGQ